MNIKLAMAFGSVLVAASTTFAQASEYQDFSNFVSTRSRAEVVAELAASRANGDTLEVRDTTYPKLPQSSIARKSRQEVLAELAAARANGDMLEVRDITYPEIPRSSVARKSRQDVLDELAQFRAERPNYNHDSDYPSAFQSTPMKQRMASTRTASTAQ